MADRFTTLYLDHHPWPRKKSFVQGLLVEVHPYGIDSF